MEMSRRAAPSYHEGIRGVARHQLAQLLQHAAPEQLLAGGELVAPEQLLAGGSETGVIFRGVHRGGGFQNSSPRNPRSSPKRFRGREGVGERKEGGDCLPYPNRCEVGKLRRRGGGG